jgi:hypothetical protein
MYLDYFFLFFVINGASIVQGKQNDESQYLFLMKEMQVKSEFKIHGSVVYLDKNVENLCGNKFLLSLGYDEKID